MDSLITAAARALAAGDPIGALNRIALRDDAPALALRGIALAQLGDLGRARILMRSAARAFGAKEPLARARCTLAETEIALASRDLRWPAGRLEAARATLEAQGDISNAAHARSIELRHLLLVGRLDEAEALLVKLDPAASPPAARAVQELVAAGIAMRRIRTADAAAALARAAAAARLAGIPALSAEVENTAHALVLPAAQRVSAGGRHPLLLRDVEALLTSGALVVDGCRHAVCSAGTTIPLATRPVLFSLARTLAEAWPADVSRSELLARVFGARQADESHRARLRVEAGRLRSLLVPLAEVRATRRGFVLAPRGRREVVVLTPPSEEEHTDVLALLADGEAWSSSALALALATSQRSVQRALDALAAAGKVQAFGQGRARRWLAPSIPGLATILLLPPPQQNG